MGFYIQDDFWEACEELPAKSQDEVFGALVRLFYTGDTNPDIKGVSKAVFIALRDRVLIAKKRSEAGKSSGKQNNEQTEIKTESNANQTSHQTDEQSESKTEGHLLKSESESEKKSKGKKNPGVRFAPPTPEDVAAYAAEKGIDIDPHRFVDYYASKGWKVGYSPMRDWKAAVRNWARRDSERKGADDAEARRYASLV